MKVARVLVPAVMLAGSILGAALVVTYGDLDRVPTLALLAQLGVGVLAGAVGLTKR